jgi:hypothetical protein
MTAAATPAVAVPAARRRPLAWGLTVFVWLLAVHALVITLLFGALGWPATTVRAIAAWKEALIAVLFGLAVARTLRTPRTGAAIYWLDLAVAGLGVLACAYLLGANAWFGSGLPITAQLYGVRDTAFVSLLYFVGRASPEAAEGPRVLRVLFAVGVVTSAIAILERIFVTPSLLVLLGASRYVQDFLGAPVITAGNAYGLPDNYWTEIGGQLVQRAGSTYLSAQVYAIAFLVILPAATLWTIAESGRRAVVRWLGYGLLWTGLLLTLTRMTIVICTLQTMAVLAARRRWDVLVGLGFAGLIGLAAAFVFAPGLADFLWRTLTWQTGSSVTHLADWSTGLEHLLRQPLGSGLGSTDIVAMRFGVTPLAADNQYLRYAVELGVLGLLLHIGVLAGAFASGVRAWLVAPREPVGGSSYGLLVAVAVCGIALNAMTAVVFNCLTLAYVFYWMAGSVTTVAHRSRSTTG